MDHDAIRKAYPSIATLDNSFVNYGLDASGNKVTIEQSKVDAARVELSKLDYKFDRLNDYPSIADQLDLIYHSGIDAWKAKIKETKDKYPKPE